METNNNQCRHKLSEKEENRTDSHMDISNKWQYFLSQGIGTVKWRGIGGVRWGEGGAKYGPIGGGCNPTNDHFPLGGVVGHSIDRCIIRLKCH